MALVGINTTRPRQKESTLDKIAKAVGIAQGVLGTGLAIPKFLQDRKEFKETSALRGEQLAEQRAKTDVAQAKSFQPASPEQVESGQAISLPSSRVFQGPVALRQTATQADTLSDFDKQLFGFLQKDFQVSNANDPNAEKFSIGGKHLFLKARSEDPTKLRGESEKREDSLRKEFLKESKTFIEQSSSMSRVEESAKEPSAAGDLALIFNYMKILDPGSTVREGEFANAESSAGVPTRIRNTYNKLVSGERLSGTQRTDFLDRARRLYKGAVKIHKSREGFYRDLANDRDLPVQNVISDLVVPFGPSSQKNAPPPSDEEASGF